MSGNGQDALGAVKTAGRLVGVGPVTKPREGSAWIIALLLASLILVAALAWQAVDAALSHRKVAAAVLRDYARLAADEFVRRSLAEVGYYGYYRVLTALRQRGPEALLPTREILLDADARIERALTLVRYFFELDPASGRLRVSGGPAPSADLEGWIVGELKSFEQETGPQAMAVGHVVLANRPHSFVYAFDEHQRLVGFEVELESLVAWLGQTFEREPILPASLAKGGDDLDFLVLSVRDAANRELYRAEKLESPEAPDPYLTATVPYGKGYEGIFEGLTAQVSFYPSAASKLVIGGLPKARLPTLLGLLVLTVGLLTAAIFQLRRARALAQLRSDFVSQVSHELRTPLTQIRMFAETLLLGRVRSEKEGRRSLEIIDQEARRLSHLVENILQFSRSERETIRLSPEPRELAPLLRDLTRDFKPLVGRGEVSFVIHPAADISARVDEDAMRQIVLNLLDNAVKYGPPKQQVILGLERIGGWARLSVDDEGPGIPTAERQRIWQSFQRLERDRCSAVAGTGIGLAVVRELVALQGGRIRVEEGERGGARFVIELPLTEPEPTAKAGHPEEVSA